MLWLAVKLDWSGQVYTFDITTFQHGTRPTCRTLVWDQTKKKLHRNPVILIRTGYKSQNAWPKTQRKEIGWVLTFGNRELVLFLVLPCKSVIWSSKEEESVVESLSQTMRNYLHAFRLCRFCSFLTFFF